MLFPSPTRIWNLSTSHHLTALSQFIIGSHLDSSHKFQVLSHSGFPYHSQSITHTATRGIFLKCTDAVRLSKFNAFSFYSWWSSESSWLPDPAAWPWTTCWPGSRYTQAFSLFLDHRYFFFVLWGWWVCSALCLCDSISPTPPSPPGWILDLFWSSSRRLS